MTIENETYSYLDKNKLNILYKQELLKYLIFLLSFMFSSTPLIIGGGGGVGLLIVGGNGGDIVIACSGGGVVEISIASSQF